MSRTANKISVSPRILGLLTKEVNRHHLGQHYRQRMQIVLYGNQGMPNNEIAKNLDCNVKTVTKWRNRFGHNKEALLAYEKGHDSKPATNKELIDKLKDILSDAPRSGTPSRLSVPDKDRLIALACESPEKYGLPFTNWTQRELAKQATKMGIKLSHVHVWRILKKRITAAQKQLLDPPQN